MNKKTTLTLFYGGVALLSVGIVATAMYLRSRLPEPDFRGIVDSGKQQVEEWFPIGQDLVATNQEGREVRLSDLKGKVFLVAEFFAVCPMCAQRNGEELHKIYESFKEHEDFHIVCITVDPDNDDVERLEAYGKALGADPGNWWFLNAGGEKETHRYLEEELKFFGVRERRDPADIKANGRFAHDLGFLLVDRDFRVIGKWPLADARSPEAKQRDPGLYERLKKDLFARIQTELDANDEN